jgi:hypothetical protein
MKTLLLVTWIVVGGVGSGQPVHSHSYQVIFSSEKTCEAARNAMLLEMQNISSSARVRAICVAQ